MAQINAVVEGVQTGTLHDLVYPKPRRLLTIEAKIGQNRPVTALVDPGAQFNLLSPMIAKEMDLKVQPFPSLNLKGANSSPMQVYGYSTTVVSIRDSRGKNEDFEVTFIVTDPAKYEMYLGMPWVEDVNPKLNWATKRLLFRGQRQKDLPGYQLVAIEDAEEFDKTMRSPSSDVYVLLVNFDEQTKPQSAIVGHSESERSETSEVPSEYTDFLDIMSEDDARTLSSHGPQDLAIELAEGEVPPFRPLYNLSAAELEVLRKYLADYLERGWIRRSKSSAGAPILFSKKKDGTLRLCVDYRGLNKITLKNRHPLPLITESLNRLSQAKYYTKLDIRDAYHRIRIKEGDEWKTAFRTRYGHFEYTVMPFGLTNAPAQFQAYINQTLIDLVDVTCIVYLDDILIFSDTKEQHIKHVKQVLTRLRQSKLFIKTSKCEWHTRKTEFLGFIVSPKGVEIDPERVKTIQEWPLPKTVRDIRIFIGFINYFRKFIAQFSKIALPLTKLTQKGPDAARGGHAQRREESQAISLSKEAIEAFQKLKDAFLEVPILAHYVVGRETKVEADASGGAIGAIISQKVPGRDGKDQWRPIDFFSRKLTQAEYNYDTHDKELLAIVKSLEHWRHYLEGIHFEVLTDHHNLKWFMETKVLNHRQVRSYLALSRYDFTLNHRAGSTNPADGPSRRPDYIAESQKPSQKYNEAFVTPLRNLLFNQRKQDEVLVGSVLTRNMRRKQLPQPLQEFLRQESREPTEPEPVDDTSDPFEESDEDGEDIGPERHNLSQSDPILLQTTEQRKEAMQQCHNQPMAGHFGSEKTYEKLRRRFTWPGMKKDTEDYCKGCLLCRMSTPAKHKPYGLIQPLPAPSRSWEEVTMDFITDLPPSKLLGQVYDSILVICDRLTKMCHYVPARSNWDGVELAQAWIREVIRLHGAPRRIISDRGVLMNSKVWETFHRYLNAKRVLSSAYHPQTDGQTERQNQTLEQYLRIFCCLEQDDWSLWISIAEFAYNDSVHATTKTTPFRANQGIDPIVPEWPFSTPPGSDAPAARDVATRVVELQQECKKKIELARAYQRKYANKKRLHIDLHVGDKVLVSNRHIRSLRPKRKLDWKYLGPGTVTAKIGETVYRVEMPGLENVHPVFHVSLLEKYSPHGRISHPPNEVVDTLREMGDDIYEVEKIVDSKQDEDGSWKYLIKWKGYPENENSWESSVDISANTLSKYWNETKHAKKADISKRRNGKLSSQPSRPKKVRRTS